MIKTAIGNYEWIEKWATIPDTEKGRTNGRTHGIVVTKDGHVVIGHQAVPAVLIYDQHGKLVKSFGDYPGAHGLTLVEENGTEYLWLTDEHSSRVVKLTLDGNEVMSLAQPPHPAYQNGKRYIPTWAAQNPDNGDIWVGDGYGAYLVHCFAKDGTYKLTLDGTEGAGAFRESHGVNLTRGTKGMEVFITDRSNHRTVVYDAATGKFLRSSLVAHSPCCFNFLNNWVIIPELFTGVKVIDRDTLKLLAEFGASDTVKPNPDGGWWPPVCPQGWPDLNGTPHIKAGTFSSPHGAAFAPNGDIYVVEWIVGGRIVKLAKRA